MPTDAPSEAKAPERTKRADNQPPKDYPAEMCWPPKWGVTRYREEWWLPDHRQKATYATEAEAYADLRRVASAMGYHAEYLCVRNLPWRDVAAWETWERDGVAKLPVWRNSAFWRDHSDIHRDHYVRVSETDRSLLAYIQTPQKGQRLVWNPIKPGRYLSKFFGHILSEREIAFMAAWQATGVYETSFADAARFPLSFARTPDEIEHVYTRGPDSCMSHGVGEYATDGYHPVRVYGAGDLAVAYLQGEHGGEEDAIVARCLVWPERKHAGRVYPSAGVTDGMFSEPEDSRAAHNALRDRLLAEGYTFEVANPGGFNGARLHYVETSGTFVLPYLDLDYGAAKTGPTGLSMLRDGQWGGRTDGLATEPVEMRTCDHCDEDYPADEATHVYTRAWASPAGGFRSGDGEYWCPNCCETTTFVCEATGRTFSNDVPSVEVDGGIGRVSEVWADLNTFVCEITEQRLPNSEMHPRHPEVWSGCDPAAIAEHFGLPLLAAAE